MVNSRNSLQKYVASSRAKLQARFQRSVGRFRMMMVGGFWNGTRTAPYQSAEQGNAVIRRLLSGNQPVMVARYGFFELKAVAGHLYANQRLLRGIIAPLHNNAGFFPQDPTLIGRFAETYSQATREIDVLCVSWFRHGLWNEEERIFRDLCPNAELVDIHALDAVRFEEPWSGALRGRKVLVIHPFSETIRRQYSQRERLFANPKTLPQFASLEIVPAVQSIAGNQVPYVDWFAALQSMCDRIDEHDYDVALIGAGAYGLPLAAHVKRRGKQAVHMGGVTQTLFGIRGRRWDNSFARYYNEHWVAPAEAERPANLERVENGCYW